MMRRTIVITEPDAKLVRTLVDSRRDHAGRDLQLLTALERRLNEARVVRPEDVARSVVTLNSRVRVRDSTSKAEALYRVVNPANADGATGKVSVLSPVGSALLGSEEGDTVTVDTPGGRRTLHVEEVLYQPEAEAERT